MDIRLAELEHPSLNNVLSKCIGRVPVFVHPLFYRALKLRCPLNVGVISWVGRVTTELGTGSLCQAIGIFTPEDFRPLVDTE